MSSDDSDSNVLYTGGGAPYDPKAPVPYWHQNMELITICVCNGLTLILIAVRLIVRWRRLKALRRDDLWILVAGILLIFPHWTSQIATNRYGSGLHSQNVPDDWIVPQWLWQIGWVGYYIVISMIKVSVCACLLEILPHSFVNLRRSVYALCAVIMALGIAESLIWVFQCQPFLSNFVYAVEPEWCVNIDNVRYAWVGISVLIDMIIIGIPFIIIRQIRLESHERFVLYSVFGANLLGSIACLFGIYGIWLNRNSNAVADLTYSESVYLMTNDIEVLMYTIGASATVFSRYFISKAAAYSSRSRPKTSSQVSWRHRMSTTFAGVHTFESSITGRPIGSVTSNGIPMASTPRTASTPFSNEKAPLKITTVPELNDVGGLGKKWGDHGRNKSKDSDNTWGDGASFRRSSEIERGISRNDSWGSPYGSPVSPAAPVWEWGSKH